MLPLLPLSIYKYIPYWYVLMFIFFFCYSLWLHARLPLKAIEGWADISGEHNGRCCESSCQKAKLRWNVNSCAVHGLLYNPNYIYIYTAPGKDREILLGIEGGGGGGELCVYCLCTYGTDCRRYLV